MIDDEQPPPGAPVRRDSRPWSGIVSRSTKTPRLPRVPVEASQPSYEVVERWSVDETAPEVSIVIPAYDEALRLPAALPRLRAAVHDEPWEVVLVDDGSSDDTVAVAVELLAGVPRGRVLRLDRHRGKGAAVRAGVADAAGAKVIFMDADMATDTAHIGEMAALLDHHGAVIGSRYAPGAVVDGISASRDHVSRLFRSLSRNAIGLPLSDFQCGFKGFRRSVARVVFHLMKEQGWAFDVELLALTGAVGVPIHEMAVQWAEVEGSHIKIITDSARMLSDVARIARGFDQATSIPLLAVDVGAMGTELQAFLDKAAPGAVAAPVDGEVVVLLPFTDRASARAIQRRLSDEMPGLRARGRLVPVEEFLLPGLQRQRTALLS